MNIDQLIRYGGNVGFDLDELVSFFEVFAMYPELVDVPNAWSAIADIAANDTEYQRLRMKRIEFVLTATRK